MAETDLRQRKQATESEKVRQDDVQIEKVQQDEVQVERRDSSDQLGLSLLDVLRAIVGIILLNSLLSYFVTGNSFFWGYRPWWIRLNVLQQRYINGPVVLTDSELALYNGEDPAKPIYVALNGTIFDVSSAVYTYGPGGPYNVFAGRDAARAYVTGCFKDDATPDLRGAEWTYIPTDIPGFTEKSDDELDEMERKYRRDMVDQALNQVDDTIKGWAEVFSGKTGKNYFEAGYIRREPGWLERLPTRPLCEAAEKQRPKPKFKKADPGESYRKSS